MTTSHQDSIVQILDENGISYRKLHHEPTKTSEESAKVRGVDLSCGGKALVLQCRPSNDSSDDDGKASHNSNNNFGLFVISASRKLHTKSIKKELQLAKKVDVRFATAEELSALTGGLVPGSVPPFGRPILDLDLFVDSSIVGNDNEIIAFNCGSLTDSIIMATSDYLKVAKPAKVFSFSK